MLHLKAGDLSREEDAVYHSYRGKGGKPGKRELPQPALRAIHAALSAFGRLTATMKPGESLCPSSGDSGRGITSGTFYGSLRRYCRAAGLPFEPMNSNMNRKQ